MWVSAPWLAWGRDPQFELPRQRRGKPPRDPTGLRGRLRVRPDARWASCGCRARPGTPAPLPGGHARLRSGWIQALMQRPAWQHSSREAHRAADRDRSLGWAPSPRAHGPDITWRRPGWPQARRVNAGQAGGRADHAGHGPDGGSTGRFDASTGQSEPSPDAPPVTSHGQGVLRGPRAGVLGGAGRAPAGGHDRGCDHHRRVGVDEEPDPAARPGDASGQEGEPVIRWDEGPHWGGRADRAGAQRGHERGGCDAGAGIAPRRPEHRGRALDWQVALRPEQRRRLAPDSAAVEAERHKASIRAKVEHPLWM